MNFIRRWIDWFVAQRGLVWLAFAACAAVFIVGTAGWYGEFFDVMQPPLWAYPFIPDCPLAAGLFGVALLTLHYRRGNNTFNTLTAVACIKYGVWTMSFWALYWARTGDIELTSLFSGPVMFATHFGLMLLGLLLLLYVRPSVKDALITLAWFALSDVVDYAPIAPRLGGYGYYPPLPLGTELVPPMLANAIIMTCVLGGGLLVWAMARRAGASRRVQKAL